MFIKRVKRKCSVRGCKNIDCFAISRTREVGNTVIICKKCVEEALETINQIKPDEKTNVPKQAASPAPPLFFNVNASEERVLEKVAKSTKEKKQK